MQIGDFLAGWVGVDFLDDDFAKTTSLTLRDEDVELLRRLSKIPSPAERAVDPFAPGTTPEDSTSSSRLGEQ